MKDFKKVLRRTVAVLLIVGAIFSMHKYLLQQRLSNVDKLTIFTEAATIQGTEKIYLNNNYIYLVNTQTATIHIFDEFGEFVKGFRLPNNSGDVWTGMNKDLHVYCVRTDYELVINRIDYKIKNIQYNNPDVFFATNNLINKNHGKLKGNIVYSSDDNQQKIHLNANVDIFSTDICIILFAICIFCFLIVSGLFKLFIDNFERTKGDGTKGDVH